MDSIVENVLKEVASGENLSTISKAVGGDEKQVQSALEMGLPMIMSALGSKSGEAGGTEMITQMMGQMGDNPMDSMSSFLGGSGAAGGSGMASSLLGSQMGTIKNTIAKKTGLPPEMVGKILEIAVPMVIGSISKTATGQKLDQVGLTSLLGDQSKMAMAASPEAADLAKQLLSSSGDVAGVAGKFKKLFGK
jgi:hypothetical protein